MSTKRSAARRLRVEALEDRAVPAVLTGTDPATVTPPAADPTKPAVTGDTTPGTTTDTTVLTSVDGDVKPTDPAPGDIVPPGSDDPASTGVILTATGTPEVTDTALPPVDLATTMTLDKPMASVGDVVTFTVKVMDRSTDPASGVTVDAALPAGLSFVSASTAQGTYDPATGVWTAGAVASGTPATLTLKAKVTDSSTQSFTASISHADQSDPQAANNTAGATVTPVLAGLQLTHAVNTRIAMVGSVVLVTLTVRSMGPGTATNLVVSESFGSGMLFVRAMTPTRGTFNPATKVWTIPNLPAGMTAMAQFVVQLSQAGTVQATASATATGIDPDASQLDATAALTVVKSSLPIGWTYFSGAGFKPATTPPPVTTPTTPKPTTPTTTTTTPTLSTPVVPSPTATATLAQILMARGFLLPAGFHL